MLRFVSFMLLVSVSACLPPTTQLIRLVATPSNPTTNIQIEVIGKHANLYIQDERGIGQAEVRTTSMRRPTQISLRFYLSGLEEVRLQYGDVEITAAIDSSAPHRVRQSVSNTAITSSQTITATSPYWLATRLVPGAAEAAQIPLEGGYIEVSLPADFFQNGHRSFAVNWIDFYR